MIAKYRIVIGGMFEPIAHELKNSGMVEVLLTDGTGGATAGALTEQLRGPFEGYSVGEPIELHSEPTY